MIFLNQGEFSQIASKTKELPKYAEDAEIEAQAGNQVADLEALELMMQHYT